MAEAEDFSSFDPAIPEDLLTQQPDVSWEYLFQPDQWYITPEVISENFFALFLSLAAVALAAGIFWFARNKGIKSKWYKDLEKGKYYFSESLIFNIWIALYIPLAIGSWLSYVHGGQTWNRALTVYALHLVVNVLFSVSLWWVQDLSLALLNLITLIGVSMFTTSQFNSILKFAGYINTPYMLWLLIFTAQYAYFWYLNEGKELMEVANLAKGGSAKKSSASAILYDKYDDDFFLNLFIKFLCDSTQLPGKRGLMSHARKELSFSLQIFDTHK